MKCLLAAGLLGATGRVTMAVARLHNPDDGIIHRLRPGLYTAQQASDELAASTLSAAFAEGERRTDEDELKVAAALQDARRARISAMEDQIRTQQAATAASLEARRVEKLERETAIVARGVEKLVGMIPEVARKAAQRAVRDVEQQARERMNLEVADTVAAVVTEEQRRKEMAADAAQKAALPFQKAKLRATQTMWSYVIKGRELAAAVTELKNKAIEIAQVSVPLQETGNPVAAQQLQMQAHDLMNKALQFEAQAKNLQAAAEKIREGLNRYDGAAVTAADYGAYQANPAGIDESPPIPPPPFPLSLPKMPLNISLSNVTAFVPGNLSFPPAPAGLAPAPATAR
mmetsp:Transcript_95466/g.275645  ORF Transcript_95466/g.275645 Transcript_95466/m.275645 type:complete len:345 (+) Transcript_95466:110-1144(+)